MEETNKGTTLLLFTICNVAFSFWSEAMAVAIAWASINKKTKQTKNKHTQTQTIKQTHEHANKHTSKQTTKQTQIPGSAICYGACFFCWPYALAATIAWGQKKQANQ